MLASLRKYSNATGTKILYGVLAAAFVIWGVGFVGSGTQQMDVVAKVYGTPITQREVDRSTAALQRRYEEMFRGRLQLPPMDLRSQALGQLIDESLLRHEADRLGIEVTDDQLVQQITTMPEFQQDGRFDRDLVERVLRDQRDRGEFEEQVRRGLLFQRLQALVTDGVQVSAAEVEERYRLDHEQVNLLFVRIPAADLAKDVTISDDQLQQYLAGHADRYRVPEKVRARYVAYKRTDFVDQATVGEDEITAYYDSHRDDRFTTPEQVRARHILVKVAPDADDAAKAAARKKAEGLRAKAVGGADFAALATKNSDDPGSATKGGDLGLFPRGRMVPAFDEVAFQLAPGAMSEVVETPFGFHVIKVEEHQQGGTKPIEAVREEIVQVLRGEKALELARQQADADRRTVVRGKTLAEAVGGRPIHETPPFAASDAIPEIGRVEAFSEAAFALGDGQVSDLIETEDAVYLLEPFARAEAHVPPLDEVRDRVLADARRERGEQLAKEKAEALLAQARTVGLAKAAADAGLAVADTGSFDRPGGAIPKLGAIPTLRTEAFALTTEKPLAPSVYTSGGDAVVVALKDRTPADMTKFSAAKDTLSDSLMQQKRGAMTQSWLDYLKQRAQQDGALEVRADAAPRG